MKLREAIILSIKKWEYVVKKGGNYKVLEILNDVPEIAKYPSNCALCMLYGSGMCHSCPLNDGGNYICCVEFHNWCGVLSKRKRLYWAKLLLKRLENELQRLDDSQELYEEAL